MVALYMPHKEFHYPADWLRIAEKDLLRVSSLLNKQDAEAAGFFSSAVNRKIP